MIEPEVPIDELPVYVLDDADEPERQRVRDAVARMAARVGELVDGDGELAAPAVLTPDGREIDDLLVVHRVVGNQPALLDAFDRRWGGQPSCTRAALATLRLHPLDERSPDRRHRRLRGHLRLHTSFVRIPVELEVEPWHNYGLVLHLRPVRHNAAHIGWHRRWAWFAGGHRLLDQMRRAMEGALVTTR